uniref:HEG protein n=1 Tax=Parazoanthus axinellae TaxID=44925 RepID=A0A0C7AV59_PARAX|nr:homing endonuclease gene [Parazoanthus axinellae]
MEPVWWAVGLFEAGGTLALVGEGVRASLGSPAGCPRTLHRFKGAVGMGTLVGGEPRGCDWVLSPKGNEVNKILKFINLINGRLITLKYNLQLMEVIKFVNHKYGTHIVYLGPGAMAPNNSWLAGFVEGAGGFHVALGASPPPGSRLVAAGGIVVTQKERYVLDLINKLLPGRVSLSNNPRGQYQYLAYTCTRWSKYLARYPLRGVKHIQHMCWLKCNLRSPRRP